MINYKVQILKLLTLNNTKDINAIFATSFSNSNAKEVMAIIRPLFTMFLIGFVISSAKSEEVLISSWHNQPSSSEQNFMKRLKKLRPNVTFKVITAERKKSILADKLRKIDLKSIKLIYAAGTNNTVMVNTLVKDRVPIVFYYVSDPVQAKLVKSNEKPGNNVTGAHFLVQPDLQFPIIAKVKKLKSVAIWFDPREKSSKFTLAKIQNKLKEMGIKAIPVKVIPDAKNIEEQLEKASALAKTVDAVYLVPSYSFYVTRKKIFSKIDPSVFSVSSIAAYASAGSTIAIGSNVSERIKNVAEIANQILDGKKASEIPVSQVTAKEAFLYVNKERMEAAGLKDIEKLGLPIKYVKVQ